ncbi:MAG: tetraacyldisaccharide 4'-kinase [Elusimicrobia bacterium]|jgi:tetraacyldisaccharide 4'-kinase|nr:tetraacyldisaccharide 4'-kinase [Elusimicrobiota bacterium]
MKLIKKLLIPPAYFLSWIYGAAVFIHKLAVKPRDAGINAGVNVVSVGNITAGGTGKTPLVINIIENLKGTGKETGIAGKVAILSRGYGRQSKGYRVINEIPDFKESGDEVKILKEKFPEVPVFLGSNRYKSAVNAVKGGARILILDDGFQSREIKRNVNIAVIDATDPFGGGVLIPAGRLREPMGALKRADSVVINRSGQVSDDRLYEIKAKIIKIKEGIEVFSGVEKLKGFKEIKGRRKVKASHFKACKILALSGIGNPEGFYNLIGAAGLEIKYKYEYRDHYLWSEKELVEINRIAEAEGLKIITTQKDAARFNQKSRESNIKGWEAVMELEIKEGKKWQKYLKENI